MERAMGRDTSTPEIGDELRREAAVWFERIHSDDVSTEQLAEWQRWVATSAAHARAFKDLEDFWRIAGAVEEPSWPTKFELEVDTYDGSMPIEAWRARARPMHSVRRHLHWPALAAAFVGAAACVAVYLLMYRGFGGATEVAVFQTASREHREVVLQDGSRVLVGAQSSVSVNLTDEERNVTVDSGEAYFEVEKDKSRPFVVRAGRGTITAVGTAFNVENVEGRVDVIVSEGAVEVLDISLPASGRSAAVHGSAPMVTAAQQPTRVEAGQRFVYGATMVSEVKTVDTARVLAARKGRLEYLGEPLKYVVADVARYTDKQLVITDPLVEETLYTGVFLESEADDWLVSLPDTYPQIEVVRIGERRVVLQLRANGHPGLAEAELERVEADPVEQ